MKGLPSPAALPQVQAAAAYEWACGWWAGILVGAVIGAGLVVLFGWAR